MCTGRVHVCQVCCFYILSSFCVDMTILKYVLCCRSLVDQLLNIDSILMM